jgi:beta-glucanase (GH16 family)
MIKKLLLTVCTALCCSFLYGKQDWKLVWNDEFDYSGTPDNSKWSFDTEGNNWDWGNNEAQNYTPAENKNAWVEDGNLIIEARKESYRWYGDGQTKEYTSARLITKGKGDWLYGKVEVKALLPTGKGMWPAIWLLSTDDTYGGWPNSGELDIMENVGFDPNKIHCNIHTEAYNHKNGTNKGNTVSTSDPSKNWHVYSMEWDAEKVIFFLDGEQVFRFDNEHKSYKEWPYDKRFHLLLNIAVGGSWGGEQGIDDGIFPQRMLVDYVRIYQYGEVEEEPVDGVLKLNTSIASTNICTGDDAVLTIDTTGTGKILYPSKLDLKVFVFNEYDNKSTDITSKIQKSDNGFILEDQPVRLGDVKYITRFSYREGEGEFEQIVYDTATVIVYAPIILETDKFEICEGDHFFIDLSDSGLKDYEWKAEESGNVISNKAILDIEPKETTNISFKATDGVCVTSASIEIKVNPRPVIASVDSIGPKDVKVVLENYDYAPYLYALDRGPFYEIDEYHNLEAREYVVSVKDANGCTVQTRFTIKEPTAVELIAGTNISVYPIGNNIIVSGAEEGASFRVVDANGISVTEGNLSVDGIVNTSSLAKGIYYVIIDGNAYPIIKR